MAKITDKLKAAASKAARNIKSRDTSYAKSALKSAGATRTASTGRADVGTIASKSSRSLSSRDTTSAKSALKSAAITKAKKPATADTVKKIAKKAGRSLKDY